MSSLSDIYVIHQMTGLSYTNIIAISIIGFIILCPIVIFIAIKVARWRYNI